ncbi:hypothetical protein SNEBB_011113 [Seison nebaliae]|nr:hypothetical protein SNEBB_011113 [Seison nebaliae]
MFFQLNIFGQYGNTSYGKSSQPLVITHDLILEELLKNESYVESLNNWFNQSKQPINYKESITAFGDYGRCMNELNRSAEQIWPKSAVELFKNKDGIKASRNACEKTRLYDESSKFLIADYDYFKNKSQWNYRLNETHWKMMVNQLGMIAFELYNFTRNGTNDSRLNRRILYRKNLLLNKEEVQKTFLIESEFFGISFRRESDLSVYHEVYYNVQSVRLMEMFREKRKLFNSNKDPNRQPFNVIILGIDSVSSQQMERLLPLSFTYAMNDMNFTHFKNAQVAGGNTYPNLFALIAGGMAYNITTTSNRGTTVEHNDDVLFMTSDGFFDNIPIIWKLLPKYYTSLFVEDYASIAGFNYMKKGFLVPPSDVYCRPFFVKSEAHSQKFQNFLYCRYEELFYNVINNLLTIFELEHELYGTNNYDMLPMFLLSFFKKCTHDRVLNAHFIDKTLLNVLKKVNKKLYLENTLLMLYGDHGSRLDAFIWSYEGTIEMGKAFIMIRLPDRFQREFEEETKNFKKNTDRLVNVFDVHKSFLHLLRNQTRTTEKDSFLDPHKRLYRKGISASQPQLINKTLSEILNSYSLRPMENRGLNFFRDEIKWNRSCNEATLTSIFCSCNYYTINAKNVNANTNVTTKNKYFVHKLMKDFPLSIFPSFPQFANICIPLEPNGILDLTISEQVNDKNLDKSSPFILNKALTVFFRTKVCLNSTFKTSYMIQQWQTRDQNDLQLLNYINKLQNNQLTFVKQGNQTISSNEDTIVYWRHNNIVYFMNRVAPAIRLDKYAITNKCLTPYQKPFERICICNSTYF